MLQLNRICLSYKILIQNCTYIEGAAGRTPMFPVKVWNHFDSAIEESPKTTNCCEGFHNALNSVFHCSHPSVWYLFDGLQRDMACHKLTLVNTEAVRPEVKKRNYANHDQLKIRPYFLPWDSKNRRYRILNGIDRIGDFLKIIEPRSLQFGRRI